MLTAPLQTIQTQSNDKALIFFYSSPLYVLVASSAKGLFVKRHISRFKSRGYTFLGGATRVTVPAHTSSHFRELGSLLMAVIANGHTQTQNLCDTM